MLDSAKVTAMTKISEELKKIREILNEWYKLEKMKYEKEMRRK